MRQIVPIFALLLTAGLIGCGGGTPPTIMTTTTRTEEELVQIKKETQIIADQEKANLAGVRYFPKDEEAERVEAEERANLATTPSRRR